MMWLKKFLFNAIIPFILLLLIGLVAFASYSAARKNKERMSLYQKEAPAGKITHMSTGSTYIIFFVFEDGSFWEYSKNRGWKMHRKSQNPSGQTSE